MMLHRRLQSSLTSLRERYSTTKKENIVSYTVEELIAMQERGESLTDWARVDAKTDAEIAADSASDPAWDGIPEDWYEHAVFTPGSATTS